MWEDFLLLQLSNSISHDRNGEKRRNDVFIRLRVEIPLVNDFSKSIVKFCKNMYVNILHTFYFQSIIQKKCGCLGYTLD